MVDREKTRFGLLTRASGGPNPLNTNSNLVTLSRGSEGQSPYEERSAMNIPLTAPGAIGTWGSRRATRGGFESRRCFRRARTNPRFTNGRGLDVIPMRNSSRRQFPELDCRI